MANKTKIIILDHTPTFEEHNEHVCDIALGSMAQDVEMMAAFKVPVDTGALARYIRKLRISARHWKVTVNKDYAEYQERGSRADGSYRVRRYSRPGSGTHFLEDAGNIAKGRKNSYFKKAASSKFNFHGQTKPVIGSSTDFEGE